MINLKVKIMNILSVKLDVKNIGKNEKSILIICCLFVLGILITEKL